MKQRELVEQQSDITQDVSGEQMENHNEQIQSDNAQSNGGQEILSPTTSEPEYELLRLVPPGRRGVTNKQMIPALKQAIAEDAVDKLTLLKLHYANVFSSSAKYLKKSEQDYIANSVK